MDTASCRDPASSAGYGASQPHGSLYQFHDRESCVAACAAAFGVGTADPAPVSQFWPTPSNVAAEIVELLAGVEGIGSTVPVVAAERATQEGGAVPSLDLIEGHNSETRVLLKTENYPGGARRVLIREVQLEADPVIVGGTPNRIKRDKSEQERVQSSVARTRKVIRQRCMSFKADRLLTLTYRENMTDRARAYRDTVTLIARARAAGYLVKYVAVPEQQKRGAWHIHIACRGFMWVQTLRRIWRGIVGQDNGNIDLSYRHRGQSNPWRIASYLSKYIGKALEQAEPGERTFWASEWGGQEPVSRIMLLPQGITLTQVQITVAHFLGRLRELGTVSALDWWSPRRKADDPPDKPGLLVYWAA